VNLSEAFAWLEDPYRLLDIFGRRVQGPHQDLIASSNTPLSTSLLEQEQGRASSSTGPLRRLRFSRATNTRSAKFVACDVLPAPPPSNPHRVRVTKDNDKRYSSDRRPGRDLCPCSSVRFGITHPSALGDYREKEQIQYSQARSRGDRPITTIVWKRSSRARRPSSSSILQLAASS
jgi:hypothetical protein